MDAARQILRFSIPGSIAILWSAVLAMMGRLFQGDSPQGIASALQSNVGAAVAILASIPVGFVIYQIYYVGYRPFVWLWPGRLRDRWIRLDRGAQVLSKLPPEQRSRIAALFGENLDVSEAHCFAQGFITKRLKVLTLKDDYVNGGVGDPMDRYRKRWHTNWDLMRALVELSEESSGGGAMRAEYTTLSDLYHALGACRTAVQTGWIVSFVLAVAYIIDGQSAWSSAGAILTGLVLTAGFFWAFHSTRRLTWISAQASLKLGLTALFKRRPDLFEPTPGT